MKRFKSLCEAWDISGAYDPGEFKDNRVRWFDSDDDIRTARNIAYRILLCKTLAEASDTVNNLFDRYSLQNPVGSKVLRAIAATLAQSNEQNWKLNLRNLYRYILK